MCVLLGGVRTAAPLLLYVARVLRATTFSSLVPPVVQTYRRRCTTYAVLGLTGTRLRYETMLRTWALAALLPHRARSFSHRHLYLHENLRGSVEWQGWVSAPLTLSGTWPG